MSDFISLTTALSGLQAAQAAIEVTSDNIANANTPGRTRQRVDLASRRPHDMSFGQVGAGVDIIGISRARDQFLDGRVRAGASATGRIEVRSDLLSRVETALDEPNGGVATALSDLFAALEDFALDPSERAGRSVVIGALESVAERIRNVASAWDDVASLAGEELVATGTQINELLRELSGINQGLVEHSVDTGENNDLLDRRDVIVDQLAEMGGFQFAEQEFGVMRVSAAGIGLVDRGSPMTLVTDPDTGNVTIPSGQAVQVSGMLGGYQSMMTDDIAAMRARMDDFATELVTTLNTTHAGGFTPDGSAGGDLMSIGPEGARTLAVVISDPNALAAAGSGPPVAEFDADNAEALADLRTNPVASGGTTTLEGMWRTVVVEAASRSASARAASRAQVTLQQAAEAARSNAHGVSLDEEMVNLIRYQRAFEASARVMSSVDQMLDLIVNRLGLVGR